MMYSSLALIKGRRWEEEMPTKRWLYLNERRSKHERRDGCSKSTAKTGSLLCIFRRSANFGWHLVTIWRNTFAIILV